MKTVTVPAFALLLAAGLAGPALAAGATNTTTPTTSSQTTDQDHVNLRNQVRDDMIKAGFSDVQVMPESFLVRAKDPRGNPVMMVINPDSFTEVTTISSNPNGANNNAPSTSNKMTNGAASPNAPTPPVK